MFLETISALQTWLKFGMELRREDAGKISATLLAIHRAANETRAYLSDIEVGACAPDRDREANLARNWELAGSEIAQFGLDGKELYDRCFDKARYWSAPAAWEGPRQRAAGIALDRLVNEVSLLAERQKRLLRMVRG